MVAEVRRSMLADFQVLGLLAELSEWPGSVLKRHNDASHLLHKLTFIADLGFRADDPEIAQIIGKILSHQSREGPFQVMMNIPTHFGGSGKDEWLWALCDAPLILYSLIKFGYGHDGRVREAVHKLTTLVRNNGWPCAAAPEIGRFRGPGSKDAPCPYANLLMLKVLALIPEWRDHEVSRIGAETLLKLWEERTLRKPYLFAMGTDFCKLKAPLIWYDILHVFDVLTRFPWLRQDRRLLEMAELIKARGDDAGRYTPESIWTAWKEWEFGQKKTPSAWVTLLVHCALRRNE